MREVTLFNNQKVLMEVNPLNDLGEPNLDAVVTWVSSDPVAVPLEISLDGRSCWCLTPLESGVSEVTISSLGYLTEKVLLTYLAPKSLNLVIHEPVEE